MIEVIGRKWISRPPLQPRTGDAGTEPVAPRDRLLAWAALGTALAAGLAARLWLAFTDDGIYWPDEIYQSLEPAHRAVFGYGMVAWEFIEGARNWAFPGLLAGVLKVCAVVGLDDPRQYLGVTRALFCLLGVATGLGVYRLARVLGAREVAAAAGAATFLLGVVPVYFAHRAMSETASAAPVVFGLAMVLEQGTPRWRRWVGASLLGLAVLLRLQNGVWCAGVLALFAARRDWRALKDVAVALAGWALLYGLIDRLTWGDFFHSARVYLKFNLVEGRASAWGTSGFLYYPRVLWTSAPLLTLALGALVAAGVRRARGVALVGAAFLLLHSLVPHKELRFIVPLLPVLGALAALGVDALADRVPRWGPLAAVAGCGAISLFGMRSLTFGQVGMYEHERPGSSALDDFGGVNRLLLAANRQPDLCGLKVEAVHLAWAGGSTYLHRYVPLYPSMGPPRESGYFNYVVTLPGVPTGFAPSGEVVAQDGPFILVRLPYNGCVRDPRYQWRLP